MNGETIENEFAICQKTANSKVTGDGFMELLIVWKWSDDKRIIRNLHDNDFYSPVIPYSDEKLREPRNLYEPLTR